MLMVGESSGVWVQIEATMTWRHVAAVKLERTLDDPSVAALLLRDRSDLTSEARRQVIQAAWLQTGDPYDVGSAVDILWRRLTGLRGMLNRRQAKNCVEMIVRAYLLGWGGWLLSPTQDPTPEALASTTKLADVWRWEAGDDG